jgi:hypothetical protein
MNSQQLALHEQKESELRAMVSETYTSLSMDIPHEVYVSVASDGSNLKTEKVLRFGPSANVRNVSLP